MLLVHEGSACTSSHGAALLHAMILCEDRPRPVIVTVHDDPHVPRTWYARLAGCRPDLARDRQPHHVCMVAGRSMDCTAWYRVRSRSVGISLLSGPTHTRHYDFRLTTSSDAGGTAGTPL